MKIRTKFIRNKLKVILIYWGQYYKTFTKPHLKWNSELMLLATLVTITITLIVCNCNWVCFFLVCNCIWLSFLLLLLLSPLTFSLYFSSLDRNKKTDVYCLQKFIIYRLHIDYITIELSVCRLRPIIDAYINIINRLQL